MVLVTVVGAQHFAPLQSQTSLPDSAKTIRTDSLKTVRVVSDSQPTQPVFLHRVDTVVVVKHQFNHREQIITGSVIMACLVGILAVMNNYNPR